jgi:hypothetical protein
MKPPTLAHPLSKSSFEGGEQVVASGGQGPNCTTERGEMQVAGLPEEKAEPEMNPPRAAHPSVKFAEDVSVQVEVPAVAQGVN